jgi:hypothetical protein
VDWHAKQIGCFHPLVCLDWMWVVCWLLGCPFPSLGCTNSCSKLYRGKILVYGKSE